MKIIYLFINIKVILSISLVQSNNLFITRFPYFYEYFRNLMITGTATEDPIEFLTDRERTDLCRKILTAPLFIHEDLKERYSYIKNKFEQINIDNIIKNVRSSINTIWFYPCNEEKHTVYNCYNSQDMKIFISSTLSNDYSFFVYYYVRYSKTEILGLSEIKSSFTENENEIDAYFLNKQEQLSAEVFKDRMNFFYTLYIDEGSRICSSVYEYAVENADASMKTYTFNIKIIKEALIVNKTDRSHVVITLYILTCSVARNTTEVSNEYYLIPDPLEDTAVFLLDLIVPGYYKLVKHFNQVSPLREKSVAFRQRNLGRNRTTSGFLNFT